MVVAQVTAVRGSPVDREKERQKPRDNLGREIVAFRVQGVPLEAVVSSIRRRTGASPRPFFYFVFPTAVLAGAPQTVFAAARVPRDRTVAVQNRVAALTLVTVGVGLAASLPVRDRSFAGSPHDPAP